MRIASIGGGPAGLYFSILLKQAFPAVELDIYERNRPDDTFGWGVVFSDETLGNFEKADPESYKAITSEFRYWGEIDTYLGDACVRSTGHGFCGMSRKRLLQLLQRRASGLGVRMHFQREIADEREVGPADLVLACDGVNSQLRKRHEQHFRPSIRLGTCRFAWLGTTKEFEAFTFLFRENEHGLWQIHAYPFEKGLSTFIVECHEDVWKRAGFERASEAERAVMTASDARARTAEAAQQARLAADRLRDQSVSADREASRRRFDAELQALKRLVEGS